jgi:hypothetical protein
MLLLDEEKSSARVGFPAHAAHTFPQGWGQVLWMGIASVARGFETACDVVLRLRESRTPLQPW